MKNGIGNAEGGAANPADERDLEEGSSSDSGVSSQDPPKEFICPITHLLMVDPVVAGDGSTYERAAIERWIGGNGVRSSPCTRKILYSKSLNPNLALKSLIEKWVDANPKSEEAVAWREAVKASKPSVTVTPTTTPAITATPTPTAAVAHDTSSTAVPISEQSPRRCSAATLMIWLGMIGVTGAIAEMAVGNRVTEDQGTRNVTFGIGIFMMMVFGVLTMFGLIGANHPGSTPEERAPLRENPRSPTL